MNDNVPAQSQQRLRAGHGPHSVEHEFSTLLHVFAASRTSLDTRQDSGTQELPRGYSALAQFNGMAPADFEGLVRSTQVSYQGYAGPGGHRMVVVAL